MDSQTPTGLPALSGDWTIGFVACQADLLRRIACDLAAARPGSTTVIDCSRIESIDTSGFQLLYTWATTLDFKGIKLLFAGFPEPILASRALLGFTALFASLDLNVRK